MKMLPDRPQPPPEQLKNCVTKTQGETLRAEPGLTEVGSPYPHNRNAAPLFLNML